MRSALRQLTVWTQAMLLLASVTASAAPVTFSASFDSFTPGPGYGVDAAGVETMPAGLPSPPFPAAGTPFPGGTGGTLLDVVFTAITGGVLSTTLPGPGSSVSGVIGNVQLRERFIDADELDGLGVTANFTFSSPVARPVSVLASGVATIGIVPPVPSLGEAGGVVDLTITWTPVTVDFGAGSAFEIALAPLSFHTLTFPPPFGSGDLTFTLDQRATLTVLPVPEPTMVYLFAVGLAVVAVAGRRRRAV